MNYARINEGKFTAAMISAAQVVERVLRDGDPALITQLTPAMLSAAQVVQAESAETLTHEQIAEPIHRRRSRSPRCTL